MLKLKRRKSKPKKALAMIHPIQKENHQMMMKMMMIRVIQTQMIVMIRIDFSIFRFLGFFQMYIIIIFKI